VSRALRRRAILLAFIAALISGFAIIQSLGSPWRDALREVVGFRRVELYVEELRLAASEQSLEPALLAAIVYVESTGRIDVVSSAGAMGLMQLMPAAASDGSKALGIPTPSEERLLNDAELNIRLGARHLAWTLKAEGGDLERALVAYNAGRAKLARWIKDAGSYALWRERTLARRDNSTLEYAHRVFAYRDLFRERASFQTDSTTQTIIK
jgi:soluble lytic murein transglycosylase